MMKKIMKPMMILIMIISLIIALQGVSMHSKVVKEEARFHALQAEYFSLAKSERDSAPADSELTQKLVKLNQYPSSLMELKLVGIGKMLTGIYILLFGILIALVVMPIRLSEMIKK